MENKKLGKYNIEISQKAAESDHFQLTYLKNRICVGDTCTVYEPQSCIYVSKTRISKKVNVEIRQNFSETMYFNSYSYYIHGGSLEQLKEIASEIERLKRK